MTQLQQHEPTTLVREFYRATGFEDIVGGPEAFDDGWRELEAEWARIGLDAYTAEVRKKKLSEATVDPDNYPHLAQCHNFVSSILTLELPPEMRRWAERLFEADLSVLDALIPHIFRWASEGNPVRRCTCRVILFEAVRLQLLLVAHRTTGLYERGVLPEQFSEHAESVIDTWFSSGPSVLPEVDLFAVLVQAAAHQLQVHADSMKQHLATVSRDLVDELRHRARLEKVFESMNAPEALLLRNALADQLDEQQLTVELLQRRNDLVLGATKRNTLDQKVKRMKKELQAGNLDGVKRRSPALIDLVDMDIEKKVKKGRARS